MNKMKRVTNIAIAIIILVYITYNINEYTRISKLESLLNFNVQDVVGIAFINDSNHLDDVRIENREEIEKIWSELNKYELKRKYKTEIVESIHYNDKVEYINKSYGGIDFYVIKEDDGFSRRIFLNEKNILVEPNTDGSYRNHEIINGQITDEQISSWKQKD